MRVVEKTDFLDDLGNRVIRKIEPEEMEMPAPKRPTAAQLQRQVDNWNAKHPVGTTVSFEEIVGRGETLRTATRDEASVFGGHTAVIFLEGKSGFVDLGHCKAVA